MSPVLYLSRPYDAGRADLKSDAQEILAEPAICADEQNSERQTLARVVRVILASKDS
jgi:hypothetical protein